MRLIDHLEKSGNINEEIPFRTLFETYKFENIEEREIHGDVNIETFSKYIRKLFPEAGFHRKRLPNGQKMRMIRGLHLRQNVPNTEESNIIAVILKALDHFSEEVDISGQTVHQIICCMRTKFKINGMEIHKIIKFNVDKSWELWIAGKEVNLQQAKISKYFQFTTNSVLGVLHIVSMMELCEGIQITKSIVCSRFHTIEDFENTCDKENTGRRRIRSMICQKLTSLIGTSKACVTCQRMIFDTSGKSQGEILKEKDKNEQRQQKNNSTTEEDLRQMIPNAPPEMITFLSSQTNNISRNPKGRRWPKEVISVFLQLYNRSPLGYEALRQSNLLVLPSPSLLLLYKNCVKQKVGFMDEIFEWMLNEAIRLQIPKEGYFGGIILDEMAVQEDLQIERNSKGIELVGLVDKGEEGNLCSTLRQGQKIRKLGNHILQLVFLGFTGFRFPKAHFVSDQIQAYDMYSLFWEATDKLQMFGFTCVYTSMDGAQCNRTFLNMHVSTMQTTIVQNPCNYEECVVFMMDYSHVIKKLRNNILKSGIKKGCTRNVTLVTGENIQWQMFCDAYHWDKQNALLIHRRLTNEHLYPSTQSKMRNHLAEQVMDTDMLHLFEEYQGSLNNGGDKMNGPIKLLKQTSKMITIFRDTRPITRLDDDRLKDLQEVVSWFEEWRKGVQETKSLLSYQCMDDISSCIRGFVELCGLMIKRRDVNVIITPSMINSDIVENMFCQQRSTFNGANSNPNVLQYQKNINSIIIGQTTVSKKSNAGQCDKTAQPLTFSKPKRKKEQTCSKDTKIKVIRF